MKINIYSLLTTIFFTAVTPAISQTKVNWWLTNSDKSALLARQKQVKFKSAGKASNQIIEVDDQKTYQEMDGFGFALTGGSAQHMIRMSARERKKLIEELFSKGDKGIGISYLRLSIGASDLNDHTFSYDDVPAGQTDSNLEHFSLKEDEKEVIPILKEILSVNPDIKILGSPWSAPVWMKTNQNIQGGMLKDEYYLVYAQYFVKYVKQMKQNGIKIDAITIQNEPFNDGNTPSNQFLAKQELRFIKDHLGPAFQSAGIRTKIILYDHNCDAPEYPISILTDPDAAKYIDGSGFHLYAGPITALSKVHDAFPQKNVYFTEMMVTNRRGFNIANPVERILIGATRNWSKNVILWNLAADPNNDPHTDNGGYTMCQGAITIYGDKVERNLAYYTIAHASKFVPAGSVRVASTETDKLASVAFKTPQNKIVVLLANKTSEIQLFSVRYKGKDAAFSIDKEAVVTLEW